MRLLRPAKQSALIGKRINSTEIFRDEKAFSSSIDAIIFLVLISISAVILMPTLTADEQYRSASYTSAQDMGTCLMNTIMGSTVDEFEYTLKPTELAGIDVNLLENSILENAEETIFTKEQHHRTFSDLVAESLVLSLYQVDNGTEKPLNPMTQMQSIETENQIEDHLERTIGQRYNYRFEAHWQPVAGYRVQSDIIIGEEAPVNAVKQKARITLPLTFSFTRAEIGEPFSENSIDAAISFPNPDKELHDMFNNSIEIASKGSSVILTEIVFPYDYLSSISGTEVSVNSEQLSCIAGPDDTTYSNPVIQSALGCMNYTKQLYGLNVEVNPDVQSIGLDLVESMNTSITDTNTEQISSHIRDYRADEINQTISLMCNATGGSTRLDLANTQLDAIYRTANPAGADIVLMIW
jgi:hypothetical protein